ncbi:hypothetical protein BCIN_14g03610 [Botrytis cinerea B05.10]|uniref:Mismatched base pair and cruciform DNA recognition protein n=3 Tax=Botryotinia fuckeliana TaxID=40559 RepID=A0A384K340_BOTFB|nr:hypothetical protein BCIN_14g03610 [Botrytis cinerea B05.10]ATZ57201.1 hypothetical protein BCIN_14g03610 [Botrytis cinerea B05.10]EMR89186.1 putative mismatched base pair and cruciform dna recognition protein [Botrytis cinerea BcDW1]CCD48882.1 hypothetical protein BofuT4P23000012001 [Botrytis cinerea T4]
MSDKNTSTLQSYLDSASGAAQSALGSITGNPADKHAAAQKHDEAALKHDASHAGISAGGFSASSSGAVTKNDPARQEGSWNQTVGSGKEFVGGILGSEEMKKDGREQNAAGRGQEAQGQLNDLGSGVKNRVQGSVGGAVAGIVGDREKEEERRDQHDAGKTQQRGVESELERQNK